MSDSLQYAALSWNDSIGPKSFHKIVETCGSVDSFFGLDVKTQMEIVGVKDGEARKDSRR
jgi:hypothetical protein